MANRLNILLTPEPLDAVAALDAVNGPGVGGIDIFLGITRPERSAELGELVSLEYHCYEEMAHSELAKLVATAESRWKILVVSCGIVWVESRWGR